MPDTISAQVSSQVRARLQARAEAEERSVAEIVRLSVEEYLRSAQFPGIVFVTAGSGERKAKIAGGPDVWSVVFVARGFDLEAARVAAHLEIPIEQVRLALDYYSAYPDEIEERLRLLDSVGSDPSQLGPNVEVVSAADLADATAA